MTRRSISVVIRSRTDGGELFRLLDALAGQRERPAEIIVIDSGSARFVLERLSAAHREGLPDRGAAARIPLILIEIPGEEYQSARSLNRAIGETSGELVAILSQDALPADDRYLERLASAFDSDRVAGAYARQVPGPGAGLLAGKDLLRTYPAESRTQSAPDCWFDNACSMIRRDRWRSRPFEEAAGIVEDHQWARRMQTAGYVVRYRADAIVRHHHDHGLASTWRRFHQEGQGLAYVHGTRPGGWRSLLGGAREVASDALWLARRRALHRWPGAVVRRAVKHAALYRGHRLAADGNEATRGEDLLERDSGQGSTR